ncbi:MAG TPA: hypothetical protein VNT26_18130 [Candidatus Sulfotelmatobacter sp.]|nr:hypothetical protein [Candidatus Sulfotelmatobacter sp.]
MALPGEVKLGAESFREYRAAFLVLRELMGLMVWLAGRPHWWLAQAGGDAGAA